ncbi:hypothetical protein QBC98_006965 [Kitasatospora acidiphila]
MSGLGEGVLLGLGQVADWFLAFASLGLVELGGGGQ